MSADGHDIVACARRWIGTPYHHQASLKGIGCDCLGLIRGVWREIYGPEPEAMQPYTRDWGDATGEETLLAVARRHLEMGDGYSDDLMAGDVVVFRMRQGAIAKHVAIASTSTEMIHAQEHIGVVEVPVGSWWRRRIAGKFQFPGKGS